MVPYTSSFNRQFFFLFPCLVHRLFERIFNVNDKSIAHIIVLKPLVCFIRIINWNSLNYGCHTHFTTKIKHLLHLLHPANHTSDNCLQSYRSNYQMGKKTSMFAYTSLVSSSVLRVAYQRLQQIWYVNILKVIISDMEIMDLWVCWPLHLPMNNSSGVNFISGGAATAAIMPSYFKSDKYGSSGWIPDAVSTIKSRLPAAAFNIPNHSLSQFQKSTHNENWSYNRPNLS